MSVSSLPCELVVLIIQHACDNGEAVSMSLVSRQFQYLTESILYRHLSISSSQVLKLLVRSLSSRPHLAQHVRSLAIYTGRVPFDVAYRLARLLMPYQERLMRLQVRFPASDLVPALYFLEALNPAHFEWITSPTWMIRPGELFQRFLTKWTRLKTLRLGNFFLDSVLASSIAALPQITHLTLLGQSNKNLEVESVRTLLEGIPRLTVLEVGDCPLRRRVIIETELGIERAAGGVKCEYADGEDEVPRRQPGRLLLSRAYSHPVALSAPLASLSEWSNDGNGSRRAIPESPLEDHVLSPNSAPTQELLSLGPDYDHEHNPSRLDMHTMKRFVSESDFNHYHHREWHRRRVHILRWVT
ncbi:unnamed protein product [Tilletia controversa]|uniref:F-box domain-containing protein n=3 Tax=Tilletia TaxID=13289 RepID=A0A8X7MUB7_9BASI|nr:hypothetical protein CF336_g3978 [Tilletia laevis]KAE8202035.1 hypothetical protein CF328_g2450 [Tilletia controversa]KAE8260786.1 hypothetical protein A4X03_0g3699 [Tilletia caries]KAE8201323.1 hypothetical protein CF335_g3766 [Tilletia laevis]KAE8248543.1 hypothetical protein A4X06_0g3630 [Tilletia controversa]